METGQDDEESIAGVCRLRHHRGVVRGLTRLNVSNDKTALLQTMNVRVGQMCHNLFGRLIYFVYDTAQVSGLELRPQAGPDLITLF